MIDDIKKLKIGKVLHDVSLKNYNTYKVGGTATCLVYPDNVECLIELLRYIKKNDIKYKVIGRGSNLIFINNFDGVLINLEQLDKLEIRNNLVTVGAGYNLIKLCMKVAKAGLTGLEFASGIPGTVGGAIFMNAGAYKSDMGYIVNRIKVLTPSLEVKIMYNKALDFHYRTSFLKKNAGYICLEATLFLRRGKTESILELMKERKERRISTQPLNMPSAGSVFRNPENDAAWRLIDSIGYKGKSIGGAKVSEKHANFIVNADKATGKDIEKLIFEVKEEVFKKHNVELQLEQEIVE